MTVSSDAPRFIACIPAAGAGRRMGTDLPKQYQMLAGRPVIAWTLDVFDALPECERIVIATDDAARLRDILAGHPVRTPMEIVPGGAQRQDSVLSALRICTADAVVLVHDAARPCVSPENVLAVARAIARHGAALLALPARDTVKLAPASGVEVVEQTLDRARVWLAQTPQGARVDLLLAALLAAQSAGVSVTDDAAALEGFGQTVRIVEGGADNIKITTPIDLLLAEVILRRQGRLPHA
jgi:2-C-methyl-D-erythritol 4-phosphate cytidylyltransferase